MMLALAMSLALAGQDAGGFHHGAWSGQCYREGALQGRDHELCKASFWIAEDGPGAEIERSADGLSVRPWTGECRAEVAPGFLPSSAFAGRGRGATVVAFIRLQIENALKACHKTLAVPKISRADVAAMLRDTDGLRPGSFVPLDPAVRAPAAAKCGQQLEQGWREGLKTHPSPEDGSVGLLMYTFSDKGVERAEDRFEAAPEMMGNFFAMRTGPGGAMIDAEKPAAAWRAPPSSWFVTTCDIAIEAWSSFVELAYYPAKEGADPIWGVRASTGVAGPEGYAISQGRIGP